MTSLSTRQRLDVRLLFSSHRAACESSEGKWESARQKEGAGAEWHGHGSTVCARGTRHWVGARVAKENCGEVVREQNVEGPERFQVGARHDLVSCFRKIPGSLARSVPFPAPPCSLARVCCPLLSLLLDEPLPHPRVYTVARVTFQNHPSYPVT